MICKLCNKEVNELNHSRHVKKCEFLYTNKYSIIDDYVNKTMPSKDLAKKYKTDFTRMKLFLIENGIHFRSYSESLKLSKKPRTKHTEECKARLSKIRKEYLLTHPNEHPWKRNSKFKSIPCETLKTILNTNNISYVEEYSIDGLLYSIDIAFPDKKIGIEINGNQHYNKDGTLKEYYLNRHNTITNSGWKLYEYHYSLVYKQEFIDSLLSILTTTYNLGLIDYSFYTTKTKQIKQPKQYLCINGCGRIVCDKGHTCKYCSAYNKRKVIRPSYEQLQSDVSTMSMVSIGKKYGVSDNAVRKWLTQYKKLSIL